MSAPLRVIVVSRSPTFARAAFDLAAIYVIPGRRVLERGSAWAAFGSKRWRIVEALAVNPGLAPWPALEEIVCGDDPDGGPLAIRALIFAHLYYARPDLSRLGLCVENLRGHGLLLRSSISTSLQAAA